jgi:hypothetical protein
VSASGRIPFDAINAAGLAQLGALLASWFPAGRVVGNEYLIGSLGGDKGESMSINLGTGKWADFATGDGGGDVVSLRAAMAHRNDRVAAARELASVLGIHINGQDKAPPGRDRLRAEWIPIIPPPPDAGKPKLDRFDTVHEYTNENDKVTHYVGRIEARGDRRKAFIPFTYGRLNGRTGWHERHPLPPRPLYDAESQLPLLTKGRDGELRESPYVRAATRAALVMLKAASELGLSPSARVRLAPGEAAAVPPDPASPWRRLRLLQAGRSDEPLDGGAPS